MKRIMLTMGCLLVQIAVCFGQQADFAKAVAKYKNSTAMSAQVTKTVHKDALTQDVVSQGTLQMKSPSEVTISTDNGSSQLIMQGSKFTMVNEGKSRTTSSETNPQFATFQTVFESILAGGSIDISQLTDLKITQEGKSMTLTITPEAADKKQARRMMFTSFTLTIDTATAALLKLRMNERGGFTEYKFTDFKFQ